MSDQILRKATVVDPITGRGWTVHHEKRLSPKASYRVKLIHHEPNWSMATHWSPDAPQVIDWFDQIADTITEIVIKGEGW